jgi:flavorubredoxin
VPAKVDEIAPGVYRICVYVPEFQLQFNHFLIKDDEPLLFHCGLRAMFPQVREAVGRVMDPSKLRWIAFSHFESDECGALNHWLELAPSAQAACSLVGAIVGVDDYAIRPSRGLTDGEVLATGKYRLRFCSTKHVPHGWDAGLLFEETQRTLLCSDLFHQAGDGEPVTASDLLGPCKATLLEYQKGPLADYFPYTPMTGGILESLADLKPRTLAVMHGSSFAGDGEQALRDLNALYREVFGRQ